MRLLLVIAALVALTRDARAHPHEGAALDSLGLRAGERRARPRGLPSPGTAQWIAVGATLVPLCLGAAAAGSDRFSGHPAQALVLGGIVLGPAAGYAYGGVGARAVPGVLLRGALVGGLLVAADRALPGLFDGGGGSSGAALPVAFLTAATLSVAVDVIHLGGTVRSHDEDLATTRAVGVRVSLRGSPAIAVEVRF